MRSFDLVDGKEVDIEQPPVTHMKAIHKAHTDLPVPDHDEHQEPESKPKSVSYKPQLHDEDEKEPDERPAKKSKKTEQKKEHKKKKQIPAADK